jgi:hypothetical protein
MKNEMMELKVRAYDLIAVMEMARKELDQVNQKIQELSQSGGEKIAESHMEKTEVLPA